MHAPQPNGRCASPTTSRRRRRPPSASSRRCGHCRRRETRQMQLDDSPIVLPDDPSFGPEVQVDYPGYRSTRWRAPARPLVTLPEELHELDGPVFGPDTVTELDSDLTRQHDG